MNFSLRKQTFFPRSSPLGRGGGGGAEERGETAVGNFKFWLFGDRNVQGIQAFWGMDRGSYIQLTSWGLSSDGRADSRQQKNHSDVNIQLIGVISLTAELPSPLIPRW